MWFANHLTLARYLLSMTYTQTLDYLYSQLPMFTRVGTSAFKKDLSNTLALCATMDNPQHKFKSVHVGGTNGKGSTSHMLAAILQVAGYKTGLYTSPHLTDFRERIRVNGQMISEQCVIDFAEQYRPEFERIQPSFFEMTVALAFKVFAEEQVDIAIVEVGLGGLLDSTNVINPLISVITNIGWDHMNILGDALHLIAEQKAGIIKPKTPVVIGEHQPEVAEVFIQTAARQQSALLFASQVWQVSVDALQPDERLLAITAQAASEGDNLALQLDLTGSYQLKNVKTVLSAVRQLRAQGFTITNQHVITALRQVKVLTGLRGRWDILGTQPLTIADTGHNPDGIAEVMQNIRAQRFKHLHVVLGMVNDKDHGKVLVQLPTQATYYFCRPDIPRGLDAEALQQTALTFGLIGQVYASVKDAIAAAKHAAQPADMIFIGGSTFVVAEAV